MKTIKYRICIFLIFSVVFIVQSARGETSNIDFAAFYREWQVSPSNALEQITPPLMELAASAKTNAANHAALHESLWGMFSTNTLRNGVGYLLPMKQTLIVNSFKISGTSSTPQEEELMSLAKTLAFLRDASALGSLFPIEYTDQDAYYAMVQRLVENGASKLTFPRAISGHFILDSDGSKAPILIMPSGLAPEEAWTSFKRFQSLQFELDDANRKVLDDICLAALMTRHLPQATREKLFAEIVSLQMLDHEEEARIARNFEVEPAAAQAQPTPAE